MDLFWIIVGFIPAVSLLVTVHEFGHFWVARKLGFKVLRFSVGFGKPLFKIVGRDPDRTEYVIAYIPLGGYVRMLDERDGTVSLHDQIDIAMAIPEATHNDTPPLAPKPTLRDPLAQLAELLPGR